MSDIAEVPAVSAGDVLDTFGLELKIIDVVVGKITTNAAQILEAARNKCAEYKDVEKFIGREDLAKKERAQLNKAAERANDTAKRIKEMWMAPLDEFDATMKLVRAEFKTASGGLDELVKSVESREKEDKRREIQEYFDSKNFDLVPLDRIFNDRWLNKTFKMPDVRKEIDARIAGIYQNIEILERTGEHGLTAKALYLQTLDMGAAMRQVDELKASAERLAREQIGREERKLHEQVGENRRELEREEREAVPASERIDSLANQALDLPAAPPPAHGGPPRIIEYICRFRGTERDLKEMRVWMSDHDIAYERISERIL
jgi:hypothetical protein